MNNDILGLFSSHWSLGQSILTYNEDEKVKDGGEININNPVSILAIAKKHNIKPIIYENDFGGYWELFQNAAKMGIEEYIYGIKFTIADSKDLTSNDYKETWGDYIFFFLCSESYYNCIKLYNLGMSQPDLKNPLVTWDEVNQFDLSNFDIASCFYTGPIGNNIMKYKHRALPKFNKVAPTQLIEVGHCLPYDQLIESKTKEFAAANNWPTQKVHSIKYYKNSDVKCAMSLRIMTNKKTGAERATLNKPEISFFSSDRFSFESYQNLIK